MPDSHRRSYGAPSRRRGKLTYEQKNQAAADKKRQRAANKESILAVHAVIAELEAARNQKESADSEQSVLEKVGLFLLGLTLFATVLTVIIFFWTMIDTERGGIESHEDNVLALRNAEWRGWDALFASHADSANALRAVNLANAAALARADTANKNAKLAGDQQHDAMVAQQSVMLGQLDEMKSQRLANIAQLRATVRADVTQYYPTDEHGVRIDDGKLGVMWGISPRFKNVGLTDAKNFVGWFTFTKIAFTGQDPTSADCPVSIRPNPSPAPTIIARDGDILLRAQYLSKQDVFDARYNRIVMLIFGHIEYNDVFPGSLLHTEDWCDIVSPVDPDHKSFSFPILRAVSD
jgi:hypothetical protein